MAFPGVPGAIIGPFTIYTMGFIVLLLLERADADRGL